LATTNNNILPAFKINLKKHCIELLEDKIQLLSNALDEITEASQNETKSSAGDKHETARAMMQIEQEKIAKQIHLLKDDLNLYKKISDSISTVRISYGSIIITDETVFYIGVSLGKINFENQEVIAISPNSPLAKLFIQHQKLSFIFNAKAYTVLAFG
jgi:hypothetical protein